MNISKTERRALEMLSFGGRIAVEKDGKRIIDAHFITREGWFMEGYGLTEFDRLRRNRLVASRDGEAYRITPKGVSALSASRRA